MATSIREKNLNMSDPEFPKFVFCIPQELTYLRALYEEQLWVSTANSYKAPDESWATFPFRVTPMIFDLGYADGSGYDTTFALCHRMNTTWGYFSLQLNLSRSENSTLYSLFFNDTGPFLDVFFSLNNNAEDVFLSCLMRSKVIPHESFGGCTEFIMTNMKRTEFLRIGEDCLAQDVSPYSQSFCLDLCVQQEIRKRMDDSFRY